MRAFAEVILCKHWERSRRNKAEDNVFSAWFSLPVCAKNLVDNFKFNIQQRHNPTIVTMSHLSNPLATPAQLYSKNPTNSLPIELQGSIRYYTARLTQAAGILLHLPQDITAQANVLLFRYWLADDLRQHEFSVRPSL